MRFSCVVLAGGNGQRFGGRKQFVHWQGKPLWRYASDACRQVADQVVVVGVDCPGGETRQGSVRNGLSQVEYERVVIVEAARPLVSPEQIMQIAMEKHPSVSYAVPSVDTVIYKGEVLDRCHTFQLQVPQAFDTRLLKEAHMRTGRGDVTDDTVLMWECFKIKPGVLRGGLNLFKVTNPGDLEYLEVIQRGL